MQVLPLVGLLFLLLSSQVFANDLEDARRAYSAGEFTEAVSLLRPLVRENNADAQYLLGRMYEQGDGLKQNTAEAAKYFRLAADQGHDMAKQRLSQLDTTAGEDSVVVDWYLPAAREGDIEAQYNLGYMYETGWGVSTNDREAARWYEEAATSGHDQAQLRLGMMTVLGLGILKDRTAGVGLLKQAATNGNRIADKLVQEVFDAGQLSDREIEKLLRGLRRILDEGEQQALDNLSANIERARLKRLSAPKDIAKEPVTQPPVEEPRIRQAAPPPPPPVISAPPEPIFNSRSAPTAPSSSFRQAEPDSRAAFRQNQFNREPEPPRREAQGMSPNNQPRSREVFVADPLANNRTQLFESTPMPDVVEPQTFAMRSGQNDEEMAQWYAQSAKAGNADAQLSLGILYLQGRGVRQNQQEGLRWIRNAAGQGHQLAQHYLELWNGQLEKHASNGTIGISWLMEQARLWDGSALFQLGFLFESGRGVVKNNGEAMKWYRLAAAQGHQEARQRLNAVSQGGAPVSKALAGASSASDTGESPLMIIAIVVLLAGVVLFVMVLGPKQLRQKLQNLSFFKRKPLKAIPHLPARNMDPEDVEFLRSLWGPEANMDAVKADAVAKAANVSPKPSSMDEQLNPEKVAEQKRAAAEELERKIAERTRAIRESIGNRAKEQQQAAEKPAAPKSERPAAAANHPGASTASSQTAASKSETASKPATTATEKKNSFSADSFNKGNISRDALASKRISADSLFGDTFPIDKDRSVVHRVDHGSKKLSADSLLSSMDSSFSKSPASAKTTGHKPVSKKADSFADLSAMGVSIKGDTVRPEAKAAEKFDRKTPPPAPEQKPVHKPAAPKFDVEEDFSISMDTDAVSQSMKPMEPPVKQVSGTVVDVNLSREEERSLAEVHFNIARMFAKGDGVPQNETLAAKWYLKAAEAGLPEAQYCLAEYYLSGRGISKDIELGLKWLQKAADSGYQPAKELLDKRRNKAS